MHTKEQIQLIAESLLLGFIPKNADERTLTFHFTLPPKASYKVTFTKEANGNWKFEGFEPDQPSLT